MYLTACNMYIHTLNDTNTNTVIRDGKINRKQEACRLWNHLFALLSQQWSFVAHMEAAVTTQKNANKNNKAAWLHPMTKTTAWSLAADARVIIEVWHGYDCNHNSKEPINSVCSSDVNRYNVSLVHYCCPEQLYCHTVILLIITNRQGHRVGTGISIVMVNELQYNLSTSSVLRVIHNPKECQTLGSVSFGVTPWNLV